MKRVLFGLILILAASAVASAQTSTYYFPQIVAGVGWRTTIFISNATADHPATGTIKFTKSDGTPFAADWLDEMGNNVSGGGNVITFQLAPGQSRKYTAIDDFPLTSGYGTVSVNATSQGFPAVLATAMFTLVDGPGNLVAEAGVPMGIALGVQAVFVDTTNGFRTGVAIANPNNAKLEIHFELLDDNGHVAGTAVRNLGPYQHMALFTDELIPGLPEMVGRLQFWCTNPMVAVALRFSPGDQFTTMPPIAVAK